MRNIGTIDNRGWETRSLDVSTTACTADKVAFSAKETRLGQFNGPAIFYSQSSLKNFDF